MWLTIFAYPMLAVSVTGLVLCAYWTVYGIIRHRSLPDDPIDEFGNGLVGALTVLAFLTSCISVAIILNSDSISPWPALVGLIVINSLAQPIALLLCWFGIRRVGMGLFAYVAFVLGYAPDTLSNMSSSRRYSLALFSAVQGGLALALGGAISAACACPLLRAAARA